MSRPRSLAAVLAAAAGLAVMAVAAAPAHAQEGEPQVGSQPARLTVTVVAEPATLTIELDGEGRPTAPARVTYDVRVANAGDGVVPGVEVVDRLPAGVTVAGQREVRFSVGDLNAGNVVREVLVADVDPSALGGETRLANVAEATSSDGQHARSEAAVTDVTVISARTVERETPAPAPAPVPAPASAPPAAPAPAEEVTGLGDTAAAREQVAGLSGEQVGFATSEAPAGGRSPWPIALAATTMMAAGSAGAVAARNRARRLAARPAA